MQTLTLSGSLTLSGPEGSSGVVDEQVELNLPDDATTWDVDEVVDDLSKVLVKSLMRSAVLTERRLVQEAQERLMQAHLERSQQLEAEQRAHEEGSDDVFLMGQFSRAWKFDDEAEEARLAADHAAREAEQAERGRDEDEPIEDAIRAWEEERRAQSALA